MHQVSYLVGADPELLSLALDPLPAGAPAVVRIRLAADGSVGEKVEALLGELDRAAVALFPRWLPGAERLDGSGNLGAAAVRALAERAAAGSPAFGPFLIDLASRCTPVHARRRSRMLAEVRAAGLARVIADAYGKASTVLLIEVPTELTPAQERALAGAAEWLVHHGRFTVWLAGQPLRVVDRVQSVAIALPGDLLRLTTEPESASSAKEQPEDAPALSFPPLSGLPRHDSAAEQALERALNPCEWAQGRHWNHTYEWHILGRPYRLDLFWPDAGLVVEVDGPEHRGRLMYADDRRRDTNLQLLGFDVLRFTNEQVLWDVQAVATKIEQLLTRRRAAGAFDTEMTHYAKH